MNKVIKIIITELLIFVLLFPTGIAADSVLFMNTGGDPEIAGHPVPVFT